MSKGRIIVNLHLEGKHLGKGSRAIKLALSPDKAGELAAKALTLALSTNVALEKATPELKPFIQAQQTAEERCEQATLLLRASLERFELTDRTPATDTLAFKILEFLQHN